MTDLVLPLTRHASGRAAPLPEPVSGAPAAPSAPEPKAAEPTEVVIPIDDGDDPDVTTPLADDVTADEIAAACGRCRRGAELARERADHDQAEAERLLEDAQREAARIIAEAEAEARPFIESAANATKEAADLAERAQRLGNAAALAVKAEAADARVKALEDERDDLTGQAAEIAGQLTRLAADRGDLDAQLAAATDGADLDRMTSLRNRLDSIRGVEAALTARRAPLLARLDVIGDGELSPIWPQKELAEARRRADPDRRTVRAGLNWAFPDRPEAVADRALEHERAVDRLASEQFAAEQARQRPRQQVYLG